MSTRARSYENVSYAICEQQRCRSVAYVSLLLRMNHFDLDIYLNTWAGPWENVSYVICEQQSHRSACTSAQRDQHLRCSLLRLYDMYTCYIQSFKILASFCNWEGWFECYCLKIPEDVFAWCGSFIKGLCFPGSGTKRKSWRAHQDRSRLVRYFNHCDACHLQHQPLQRVLSFQSTKNG